MDKIEKLVGRRIAYLRKTSGITQEVLAEKANISRDFLSRVERGISSISLSNIEAIAGALNVPVKELFDFARKTEAEQMIENIAVLLRGIERDSLKRWHDALRILLTKK